MRALVPSAGRMAPWIVVRGAVPPPAQGWKVHVSASVADAPEVLRRCVPVLVARHAEFKVAESLRFLADLNDGGRGLPQIGKFLTAYPLDDETAVALAHELDDATVGLCGPRIPSDRPLRDGGIVHYRYGAFDVQRVRTRLGAIRPALVGSDGDLVEDVRSTSYSPPPGIPDPFVSSAPAEASGERRSLVVGGRFLAVEPVSRTPRGAVVRAVDLVTRGRCLLKRADRGAIARPDGRDALDDLRLEADRLAGLAGDERFPQVLALVPEGTSLYLAMTELPGADLDRLTVPGFVAGSFLPLATVLAWGRRLAGALGALHATGFVHRDVKPTNVIVDRAGNVGLIDLELSVPIGVGDETSIRGSRGFASPQQWCGDVAAVTDDVFAVGAVLVRVTTGAVLGELPRTTSLASLPLERLRPDIHPALASALRHLTADEPEDRPSSMAEVEQLLAAIESAELATARRARSRAPGEPDRCERAAGRARALGDAAVALATEPPGGGLAWRSDHSEAAGYASRDIAIGSGGVVLALAELVRAFDDDVHRSALVDAARWLARSPRPDGFVAPGLYAGELGVAAAVLRAGQVLGDAQLVDAGDRLGRAVTGLPHESPDLYNGTAGRILGHLLLWDGTGAEVHLDAAVAGGEHLLAAGQRAGGAWPLWEFPAGYGGLSSTAPLGYAHGAAGIADALLELHCVTGDDRLAAAVRGVVDVLARTAGDVLDGDGAAWPRLVGGPMTTATWCNGAAGIGRFLLRAGATDLAIRAGTAAVDGYRFAMPAYCHGLCGSIELALDLHQAGAGTHWLDRARELEDLLEPWAVEHRGVPAFVGDDPVGPSPDLLVGFGGIALASLRLAAPDREPGLLTRASFQQR